MTIDKAIAYHREVARRNRILNDSDELVQKSYDAHFDKLKCKKCEKEHKQLAEWLEELKAYRESVFSGDMTQAMLKEERNKAIDDFIHECDKYCGYYAGKNKNLTREDMLNIAERLKGRMNNEFI